MRNAESLSVNETTLNHSPKNPKAVFLERASDQTKAYITDLESSLAINKTILGELVKKHVWSLQEKRVVEKLTQESVMLQEQVKKLVRERDELQMKLLISEQINENYKRREAEMMQDMAIAKLQFANQLNRKSALNKTLENRYMQLISVLKIIAPSDQRIAQLLILFKVDSGSNAVSNDSGKPEPNTENSLSEDEESSANSDTLDQPRRNRKYSVNVNPRPMFREGGKEALEKEADQLRVKVLELYKRNLKLSEALRVEKERGQRNDTEDSPSSCLLEGSLKRWGSINKKTPFIRIELKEEPEEKEEDYEKEKVTESIKEGNLEFNSFSWGKPLSNQIV
eukprot:TRINITY_DN4563_c0_g1_i1.p1 TRINITY_DN4563_c0_g1~~TRINITY_DN4563_c0_g1_i1.p1  ORF type:complete len:339 (+),score=92.99 TRINITY_DN4563_c0_g1_i1:122-1138(+)